MYPIRSRLVRFGLAGEDDILAAHDPEFLKATQLPEERRVVVDCRSREVNDRAFVDGEIVCYRLTYPRREAMARVRPLARKRLLEPLSYKGHVIQAEISGDGVRWHLSFMGERLSTHGSPDAAKMVVDKQEQAKQREEVRSWSDARVSAEAQRRGLPTLSQLKLVQGMDMVQPLKGPITRALEQGHPVTAIPVHTAGRPDTVDLTRIEVEEQPSKSNLTPLLLGGAAIAAVLVLGK